MRTPVVAVTGVNPTAMDAALLGLAWDLPGAVAVRHHIDPVSQVLTRVVSDRDGVVERHVTDLEHACVTCALREDVLPTLERLAGDRRWSTVVAALPLGAEADQLAAAVSRDRRLARRLRLAAVVAAVSATTTVDDLVGDDLLADRGRHTGHDDERGVGEVACAQVELADVVVVDGDPGDEATDLVRALARPDAEVVLGADRVDAPALVGRRHEHRLALAWRLPTPTATMGPGAGVPAWPGRHAWRIELASPRALHPERLIDGLEALAGGPMRSRGGFWVPTRPDVLQEWSGAGSHLSIGSLGHHAAWGRRTPATHLVLTGLHPAPSDLRAAFEAIVLTAAESAHGPTGWHVVEDGLEPWLGEIHDAA